MMRELSISFLSIAFMLCLLFWSGASNGVRASKIHC
jgi:hypothetical protein